MLDVRGGTRRIDRPSAFSIIGQRRGIYIFCRHSRRNIAPDVQRRLLEGQWTPSAQSLRTRARRDLERPIADKMYIFVTSRLVCAMMSSGRLHRQKSAAYRARLSTSDPARSRNAAAARSTGPIDPFSPGFSADLAGTDNGCVTLRNHCLRSPLANDTKAASWLFKCKKPANAAA